MKLHITILLGCILPTQVLAKEADLNEIARPANTYNYASNSTFEHLTTVDEFYKEPFQLSLFDPKNGEDSARLWSQSKSIFGYGFGVAGAIWLMPEDISQWDKDGSAFKKWGEHVIEGPVWDRDVGWINFIGHPYFGGVYYQAARKSGYRQWDSFMYSVLMSTFYWEYGLEAFAEVPSIQDLVITPVLGWVTGEWAYQTEMDIRKGGGTVMGSELLGDISLFALDPVDSLGHGINLLFGREIIIAGSGYINVSEVPLPRGGSEQQFQVNLNYALGSGKAYSGYKNYSDYTKYSGDPIDTSIIGITLGGGYINPHKSWQLKPGEFAETSLGLYFTKQISARLSYARGELESETADERVTYENYSVNGQYYFNTDHDLRPYILAGFGEMMRDQNRDKKTFVSHAGVGLHYKINNKFAVQADIKRYIGTRYDNLDDVAAVNLIYRFNKGEWY